MSTRIGSFVDGHFHPRLLAALVKIAVIGTWRGRTFLDDDRDLDDVADFVPAEPAPTVTLISPAASHGDASHSVAA